MCSLCGCPSVCVCVWLLRFTEVVCLKWFHGNQVDVTGGICCLKLSWKQGECTYVYTLLLKLTS